MTYKELNSIAKNKMGIDLDEYKASIQTEITLLEVNFTDQAITLLDGNENDKGLFKNYFTNTRQFRNKTTKAGYLMKDNPNLEGLTSDIIFINSTLLTDSLERKEIILIHELCHLIEQNKYHEKIKLSFSEEDEDLGMEIQKIADEVAEFGGAFSDPFHNEVFGGLLSYFMGQYDDTRKAVLIGQALQPNFGDDRNEDFAKVIKKHRAN